MKTHRGWTLIEMIISLAILAVLLSLALPALHSVMAKSQSTQNLANMRQTMQDFAVWSNMHNGKMLNMGLPQHAEAYSQFTIGDQRPSIELRNNLYLGLTESWPLVLYNAFGHASPHWQSTFSNPAQWLAPGYDSAADLSHARRTDPEWEWKLPSFFVYSPTMLTNPGVWRSPGLGLDHSEFAKWFAEVNAADIAHPSNKGVLLHKIAEPGPGQQRLVAFADGAASARDLLTARPAAVSPMMNDVTKRGTPVISTEHGFQGTDW